MSRWFLKAQYGTGGGGGGHTIVDDGGTTLEQRSKLQFKGTYSEDNMTGNTTEVNITRTMTRSDFELLSNDEKKGLINVIDETSGIDGKFQPIIYSEEEREVGVWIDGKPLYEKTIAKSQSLAFSSQTVVEDLTSLNIDTFVGFVNSSFEADGNVVVGDAAAYLIYDETAKSLKGMQKYSERVIVGVLITKFCYTKTTDTAGSGTWTPQGVPAHHYSTDEQIVGTWTDGSTLYQKTYSYSISSETSQEIATLDSNIIVKEIKGVIHNNGADMNIPWIDASFFYNIYITSAHKLTAIKKNTGDWTSQPVEITLLYTKSST